MNKQFFNMQPTFTLVCKNQFSHYLMLRNTKTNTVRFFKDLTPIPIDLPFGPERLANLKFGIPIQILGILKIEFKIDKPSIFQALNTIYYAESKFQSEKFENCCFFENEEPVWLGNEEIRKCCGSDKTAALVDFLEKGGKYHDLSYMGEEE